MVLKKVGTPVKLTVIKNGAFSMDIDYLAALIEKQWPAKEVSIDDLHHAVKSIGILNYSADDMNSLIGRLQAMGFKVITTK